MYDSGSAVTGPDSSLVLNCQHTELPYADDEHDNPPSHFKLALGQLPLI